MSALKTTVVTAAEIISAVGIVFEDKKVTLGEIIGLTPHLVRLPSVIKNIQTALDELKTLTPAQLQDIQNEVGKKLNLQNKKAEEITELTIGWLLYTSNVVIGVIKAVKA